MSQIRLQLCLCVCANVGVYAPDTRAVFAARAEVRSPWPPTVSLLGFNGARTHTHIHTHVEDERDVIRREGVFPPCHVHVFFITFTRALGPHAYYNGV